MHTHIEHEGRCDTCTSEQLAYCDEHKLAMSQLEHLKDIPSAVSKMTGVLGVIGTLFTLLVGLLFNAHFEDKKNTEMYSNKIDSLSTQISKLENDTNKSISAVKSDVFKVTVQLEQMERDRRLLRHKEEEARSKK